MRRIIRRFVILASAVVAAVSCGTTETGDNELEEFVEFYKEVVYIPGASGSITRYWRFIPLALSWDEVSEASIPTDAEVIPIFTPLPQPSANGITSPAAQGGSQSAGIVALFAGGRGPGSALASTRAALYDVTGKMVTGLAMTTARIEHAMAPLSGERVLITGGFGPQIPTAVLNSSEVFSLATRTFVASGTMLTRRAAHTATPLSDGRVLIAGGSVPDQGTGPSTTPSATTEFFDPVSGTFTAGPSMVAARAGHTAIPLNDGRILMLGGNTTRSAEVYTPSSNTFTAVGQMSSVHAFGHAAVKLADGKVFITGGDLGANINPGAGAEVFDPSANTFTPAANMSAPRMQHFAVLLDDGRVLIGGGRTTGGDALSSAELFNPATNSFQPAPAMPGESYAGAAAFVAGARPRQ